MTADKNCGLRIVSTALVAYWLASAIDLGGLFRWNAAVLVFVIPWEYIALIATTYQAIRKRDWYSLALLASIYAAIFTRTILQDEWWHRWESHTAEDAIGEWYRITQHFAKLWTILLVLACLSFALYTARLKLRDASVRERLTTWMAAIIGALGFPMAPAARLAVVYESGRGGGGIFGLFPVAVISLVLLGAAIRGPQAVASRSLSPS